MDDLISIQHKNGYEKYLRQALEKNKPEQLIKLPRLPMNYPKLKLAMIV